MVNLSTTVFCRVGARVTFVADIVAYRPNILLNSFRGMAT